MSGTVNTPILAFEADIVSFDVLAANIVLGDVVAIDAGNDMAVVTGTEALANMAIGVAESCRATSALVGSSTQEEAVIGEKVAVRLKGIVNVEVSDANVVRGMQVQGSDNGCVMEAANATSALTLGIALTSAEIGSLTKVLLRGY